MEGLLRPFWKRGLVRLPGSTADMVSRTASLKLVDEVTKWRGDGRGYHNDTVMAQWMVEHNLEKIKRSVLAPAVTVSDERPSWLLESV